MVSNKAIKNRVVIFNLLRESFALERKISDSGTKAKFQRNKAKIQKVFKQLFNLLEIKGRYLEVYVTSEQKMRFYNKKFRNEDKSSLVLSFEHPKDFPVPYLKFKPLGEIYLSVKVFKSETLVHSLLHCLLHLLGFKHGRSMEKKEKEILCLI